MSDITNGNLPNDADLEPNPDETKPGAGFLPPAHPISGEAPPEPVDD